MPCQHLNKKWGYSPDYPFVGVCDDCKKALIICESGESCLKVKHGPACKAQNRSETSEDGAMRDGWRNIEGRNYCAACTKYKQNRRGMSTHPRRPARIKRVPMKLPSPPPVPIPAPTRHGYIAFQTPEGVKRMAFTIPGDAEPIYTNTEFKHGLCLGLNLAAGGPTKILELREY